MLGLNQFLGFWMGGGGGPLNVVPLHSVCQAAGGPAYAFTLVNIGNPEPDRYVIIAVGSRQDTGAVPPTSVKIGITTFDIIIDEVNGDNYIGLFGAIVNTGSSVTVDVLWPGARLQCCIGVWSVYNLLELTPKAVAANTGDPTLLDMATSLNSAAIAATFATATPTAFTWTGLIEDFEVAANAGRLTGASEEVLTASFNRDIECDTTAGGVQNQVGVGVVFIQGEQPPGPHSFYINGLDEVMYRVLSTSIPNTTSFTYSFWMKVIEFDEPDHFAEIFSVSDPDLVNGYLSGQLFTESGFPQAVMTLQEIGDWSEIGDTGTTVGVEQWHHYVIRYDSNEATAGNRLRQYLDGVLLAESEVLGGPALGETHKLFQNGYWHNIGSYLDDTSPVTPSGIAGEKRLAFIDVIEGQSRAPTDFAFNNAGTWTRKPYTATPYGTHGFSLDGVDGFNDAVNNWDFTGHNMTVADNLSLDLPPWV